MSKKYRIEKLLDILDIPAESIDDFLVDLKAWHETVNAIKAVPNILSIPEGSITTCEFMTWIDDKKHDVRIHFKEIKKS